MGNHHEPLMALGPINWDDVPLHSLKLFADGILADAQTVIDSIPSPEIAPAAVGRGRLRNEASTQLHVAGSPKPAAPLQTHRSAESQATADQLRQEWRQVKPNVKDNPLGISVYKLPSKDGRGAWFSRRSLHEGLDFDAWKSGLEEEFSETMKVFHSEPGSGGIRGISAETRVENRPVDGVGNLSGMPLDPFTMQDSPGY